MPHPQSKRAKAAKRQRAAERKKQTADESQARVERHAETEERRQAVRTRRQRKARRSNIVAWVAAVVIVGGVGALLWNEFRPGPELAGVERPPYDGRGHVPSPTYSSEAPTSGAHAGQSPQCGIYTTPLLPSLAVHGLEHGAVVLWYDAARPDLAAGLAEIANNWDSHVIVSPSARLDSPIVATAWQRSKAYQDVVPEVDEFVATYRQRGPEDVACDIP